VSTPIAGHCHRDAETQPKEEFFYLTGATMSNNRVYVGFDGTGLFKIGITSDTKKRLQQLRTANPTYYYLFSFPADKPAVIELSLHTKFESLRVSGEWFALGADDVWWIYQNYINGKHTKEEIYQIWDAIYLEKIAKNPYFRDHIEDYELDTL
jgi:Meiotically up-regulated gene 113